MFTENLKWYRDSAETAVGCWGRLADKLNGIELDARDGATSLDSLTRITEARKRCDRAAWTARKRSTLASVMLRG